MGVKGPENVKYSEYSEKNSEHLLNNKNEITRPFLLYEIKWAFL